MSLHSIGFDANLSAVAGADDDLRAELREAFRESVACQLDLLERSRCDGNWMMAAMRLKGLAMSFHAAELAAIAQDALTSAPGEPAIVRRGREFLHALPG